MIITSFSNPKVKLIRKLDQKKYRQETGLCFIEGLRTVGEAIQIGAPIESLITCPELLVSEFGQSLLADQKLRDIEQIEVSADIYRKIAHKDGPQGMGAIVRQQWQAVEEIEVGPDDLWIALDAVSDPGNLGTIMRTADAVGCRGLILLGQSTDPYDPTAIKASMGAIFSLILTQTSWETFISWKETHRMMLIGTSDSAEMDYQAFIYTRPLILLMGSERHGLSPQMALGCDQMVRIPMVGRSDSLNLAVATAVTLYEIFNQFRKSEGVKQ
jgi:TrmH family RNA methyltransferase